MVNNKIAQRAVAAGLTGLMAFGAAAPAALATGIDVKAFSWYDKNSSDDGDFFKRIGGDTRYDTMKKIVEAYNEYNYRTGYSLLNGATTKDVWNYHSTAVLASGDNFPDALAANGLAGYLTNESNARHGLVDSLGTNGAVPVILTKAGSLSSQAKDLLKQMQVQNVIIMGGTAAVSQDVEDAINKMGIGTSRVAGKDRQETSLKALQRINGNWEGRKGTYDLIIATGDNYADALSISPYAYRMGTPVILTKKDGTLTDEQVEAIKANDKIVEIVIVGGTSAVSDAVMGQIGTLKNNKVGVHYTRLAGADRYETSAKIAEFEVAAWTDYYNYLWSSSKKYDKYYDNNASVWSVLGFDNGFRFDHVVVATGENFPDALAGGQLAGGFGIDVEDFGLWNPCPLLLTKDGNNQAERTIEAQINRKGYTVGTDVYTTVNSWYKTLYGSYGRETDVVDALLLDGWYNGTGAKFIKTSALRDGDAGSIQPYLYGNEYGTLTVKMKAGDSTTVTEPFGGKPKWIEYEGADGKWVDETALWTYDSKSNTLNYEDADMNQFTVQNPDIKGSYTVNGIKYRWELDTKEVEVSDPVIDYIVVDGTKYTDAKLVTNDGKVTGFSFDGGKKFIAIDQLVEQEDRDETNHFNRTNVSTEQKFTLRQTSWSNDLVIAYTGTDADFYGIILGGTKAVSNDKRDDLDKAVKFVAGYDIATVNGLVSDRVTLNSYEYTRLYTTDTAVTYKGNTAYVYGIVGSEDYVLYVPETKGWCYVRGGANNVEYKGLAKVANPGFSAGYTDFPIV